jgi:flagellar biosynthesis protein FlhG
MEAEVDFGVKLEHLTDLLQSGALSMGDLIETVKSQQFEINQLKKENNLLKSKLVKAINQGYKI